MPAYSISVSLFFLNKLYIMKKYLFIIVVLLSVLSCDAYWERQNMKNYESPFKGNWAAKYTGDKEGTFVLEVGNSGSIFGRRNTDDYLGGKVLETGALLGLTSPTTGFMIQGSLITKTGNWKMGEVSGSWTIEKQ